MDEDQARGYAAKRLEPDGSLRGIAEWNGLTLEELTKKLREEVGAANEAREKRAAEAEREKMFKNVGRNDPYLSDWRATI